MKKLILTISVALGTMAYGQNWNIQGGIGGHLWNITQFKGFGMTLNLGTTYDFNKIVGFGFNFNYDQVGEERIKRLGLKANIHLIPLLTSSKSKFGLDIHAGFGGINNSNKLYNDSYIFRGDDAWNRSIGMTSSIEINTNTQVTIDLTLNNNSITYTQLRNYTNLTFGIRKYLN
jgi:hypothetical protein